MRKNIALRALYDFANSMVMIIFLFYFSQWLVVEHGVPEIWYNVTLIAGSVLFIIFAPYLGKLVDQGASKIKGLRLRTIISIILYGIVGAMALRTPQYIVAITIIYSLALAAYLLCFVYYTPMLADLAEKQGNNAQVSGRGQGVNSMGQIVGLLISIPILNGAIPFLGEGRASTLLPAAILFLIFALPMLIGYNLKDKPIPAELKQMNIRKSVKDLFSHKVIALFLVGYFLYSDAVQTFGNNFPLYLEKVHMVSDTQKSILAASILLCASLSAFFTGKRADRIGLKKSLMIILIVMCIVFPIFAFIKGFALLAVMTCITGLFYGPLRSVSRALLSRILPSHLTGRGFSFYTVAERFATMVGPLVWGGIVTGLGGTALGYTRALIAMSVIVIIGLLAVVKVKVKKA